MNYDYAKLIKIGISAKELAETFLHDYFRNKEVLYPINPFQMLRDLGVIYVLKPFNKCEGIYIPAENDDDFSLVAINAKRLITEQRFTAAHEICHHLKDRNRNFMCYAHSDTDIEKYADAFAAELLMPINELSRQVHKYSIDGFVSNDDVLRIANYFGVSFEACLFRIAYKFNAIRGDTSSSKLKCITKTYQPDLKRKDLDLREIVLYDQLVDASVDAFKFVPTEYAKLKFMMEYVFHDSRLEGVDIELEQVAEIVADLSYYKQESAYCKEENKNIIEVAGLSFAYDYVFNFNDDISVYEAKKINELLYITSPFPEFGGRYRESNTLVLGAKFETVDYRDIPSRMYSLSSDVDELLKNESAYTLSEYIKRAIHIHYKMTVIHAFRDGNGRTSRAFFNLLLLKKGLPPVFFDNQSKDIYKDALKEIDMNGDFDNLYEVFYKAIFATHIKLSDSDLIEN